MRRKFLPSVSFILLAILLFSITSSASEDVFSLSFGPQDLIFAKLKNWDRVKLVEGRLSGEPGTPLLPVKFVQIAIPSGLEVEGVEVISSEHEELPGRYQIYPAQPFYPLSGFPGEDEKLEFVEPDVSVYESSSEYPGKLAELTNNGFLGGQHIAGVALHPLQYIPSEGRLIFYTKIELKLILKPTSRFPAPVNRRSEKGVRFYSDLIKRVVINPEDVKLDTKGLLSRGEEVDYLIITDAGFISAFQELADWKIRKGISTEIKEISWVLSNYSGYDDPEKIRNCIREYYSNHGTLWVLLGGDTDILPHRLAPVMSEAIPCDLYFSDLDSNWDANGNQVYGEYEDGVDMYPDVFVGRAPSDDLSQAQTFVDKCITYEASPPTDYQDKILYAAEVLWDGPFTDAAVLKEYIDGNFVPDHFQATKLYETSGNLNRTTFRDGLNSGQNVINHAGHGNYDGFSIGPDSWYSSDMDDLTNAPRYSLFYTFGCITAAIDSDCVAEHFVNNSNGGGFAYCGNTRFGWGMRGEPLQGPGPEFDMEFFRTLFDGATYQIGKTLGDSKIPFIPIAQDPSDAGPYYRWTMFTLLLLGDPTLELFTDTPAELSVSHAPTIIAGSSHFQVNVAEDSALVCCAKDGEIMGRGYSAGGVVTVFFDSPLVTFGAMQVTVTKHDHLAYRDSAMVIPPEGPYVIYHSRQIDDSAGNDNGAVNPGETILMPLTVRNIGLDPAYGVTAKLREEDQYVSITDSVDSFGDIDSGMTAESLDEYVFVVDAGCPDSHVVSFDLEATDGESTWVTSFLEIVAEPDFVISALPETTVINQGDSTSFAVVVTSLGGFNNAVDLSHSELPPGVSGLLDPDQLVPTDGSFLHLFTTLDASPQILTITITASGGQITREDRVVLAILAPPYPGPVWYVSTTGDDLVGNGSEQFPFRTIEKGMASADNEDTVLVERGRYVENIDFAGKDILVASRFIFDGLESTLDSTIIDGDGSASVVTFQSGEDSTSVIRGLTLTKGYNTYGGGIYCDGASPSIVENKVVENACLWGRSGPGIFCTNGSHPKIYRNLVARCTGPGAIGVREDSYPLLLNNTICCNSGGGIMITSDAHPEVRNNILYNNAHYGIFLFLASCDVSYNDVYGHDADYARDMEDQTGINGNISADPFLEDVLGGDYHLMANSPCIDAGDPADPAPPGGGTRIDMGAWEYYKRPDFSMTVAPDSLRLLLGGDSASIKLVLTSFMGFDETVDLTCLELPSGVSASFDPNHLVPTDSSVLTLSTGSGASSGMYSIMVAASGGDITHRRHVVLELASYFGPVWHVSVSGDDSTGDGSLEFPFRTIQKGIDTAIDGDTVLAERGHYVERIDFRGRAVLLASDFIFDGLESTIESTIIDANYSGRVVTCDSEEDSNSVIRGFTITRGYSALGAGIYCTGSSPTILENRLVANACNPQTSGGVAIACYGSQAKILRNLITECVGKAAVAVRDQSTVRLINNTFCSNSGGGVSIISGSNAYLKNNIFYGNADYGIHLSGASCDVSYNDVFGQDEDYAGDIADQTGINGNISTDPLLEDTSSGDYHLMPNSPCVDAGDPADPVPPGGGGRIDMGAFEYHKGPDFGIALIPDSVRVFLGDSVAIRVKITSFDGFSELVNLSCSEPPSGVSCALYPDQLVPTDSSTLLIHTSTDTPSGIHHITVTASGGDITHDRQLVLELRSYFGPLWHISTAGDDASGDGSSGSPFHTIQKGIGLSRDGDTVLTERGRYVERIDFSGKSILVASHTIFDGLESTIESTIVDGNGSGSVVTFHSGEDSASTLRGYTLTGGYAEYGGGIYVEGSSPTIAENFLVENACITAGSGIFCGDGSSPTIYHNLICDGSGASAIGLSTGSARVINNTICSNDFGGVSAQFGSSLYLKNNILCGNGDYGVHAANSQWTISHNDIYGHEENYSGLTDQTGISGNISADPLFLDPSSDDYHLTSASPCLGTGDPPGVDMGAFEYSLGPDFAITGVPDTASVPAGYWLSLKFVVVSVAGFDLPVDLTCSELPPGISGQFYPDQLVPTDSATFVIDAELDVPLGSYAVSVIATGGDTTHQCELTLKVVAPGRIWHVSTEGDDATGDGSEEDPFRTVQKGIDSAQDRDTVLAEKGRYVEYISFCGKAIVVASGFIFDRLESTIDSTIIDANGLASAVRFHSAEDSASVITGFTLTGGYAIYGGGISCYASSPTIIENHVVENACKPGKAGPGIYCANLSNPKICGNVIARCDGPAAISVQSGSNPEIINNTVCDNTWGGISVIGGSHPYVKNNILCNNVAYGIHVANGSCDALYNDVSGQDDNYVGEIGDQTGINGNISSDPLFVDPSAGDYHLSPTSPCIDAGDPADPAPPGGGARADMGAFEYLTLVVGDASGDGEINVGDVIYLVNYLFRNGWPPYMSEAGDANSDGVVNIGDVVYLVCYLYRNGPPPGEGNGKRMAHGPAARLWLAERTVSGDRSTVGILIAGELPVDVAGVQLTIACASTDLDLDPVLPANLPGLEVYSSQKDGLLRVGVVDLKGESFIPAGAEVDLLVLEWEGAGLTDMRLAEAVLSDRNGYIVPVKILSEDETEELRPQSFSLLQNYPNPFNPQTQINYALPQACDVKVTIYNLLGQKVRVLVDEHQDAGYQRIHWDGKDEQSLDVASGVYFYQIEAGDFVDAKKMLLLK